GRVSAQVLAWRVDGYSGSILVEARNLPEGVSVEPVVIGPSQTSAPIVFQADAGASADVSTVQLVGRGLTETGEALFPILDGQAPTGEPITRPVLAGGMTWPPAIANVPPLARLTSGFVVAVRPSAPFSIDV